MQRNFIQIETNTGIKEFELYQGDITDLPFHVDLIAISAFSNEYSPTPSSIIGQFYNKGINIRLLSKTPILELRESMGIWISKNISDKKIICVEITGTNQTFEGAIKNMFSAISVLEIHGDKNYCIALPLLGAGNQKVNKKTVIKSIIENSLEFLRFSRYLNKVIFVVDSNQSAEEFNKEMNISLGRNKIETPKGQLVELIRLDVTKTLDSLLNKAPDNLILKDLRRVINSDFKSFEFGAISRKVLEFILNDLNPETKKQFELYKKIDALASKSVALWVLSYMHIIRVFGNEAVHNKEKEARVPDSVKAKDLEIGLYCLQRILEFYQQNKNNLKNDTKV
jgi:hypothetical protein